MVCESFLAAWRDERYGWRFLGSERSACLVVLATTIVVTMVKPGRLGERKTKGEFLCWWRRRRPEQQFGICALEGFSAWRRWFLNVQVMIGEFLLRSDDDEFKTIDSSYF